MKKRSLISVVAAVIVVTMLFTVQTILPAGAAPAGTGLLAGEGTEESPYLVATADDLYNIWFDTDAHYRQVADIVFKEEDFAEGGDYYNGGQGWYPISSFSGRFDGDGYIISGLVIKTSWSNAGLFDSVNQEAEITNVTLVDVDIEGDSTVGGLVGFSRGKISNSEVSGKVAGSYLVGGLVGQNAGSIKNSVARVEVDGEGIYNGGLVGANANSGSIEDSEAWAIVHGGDDTGGLVGWNIGSIINSEVSGKVSGDSQVGGLVGLNHGMIAVSTADVEVHGENVIGGLVGQNGRMDNEGIVIVSAAHGDVYGKEAVGGLVGRNGGYDFFSGVMASVATGAVRGDKTVGGLVGQNQGSITQAVAYGEVQGENGAGGLVGENTGNIMESYAHGQVAGHEVIGGLTGFNSGNIIDSYAIGKVIGDNSVGGMVGSAGGQGIRRLSIDQPKIANSFWNTETSGQEESAGGVGRTTEELTSFFPYGDAGWDFIGETVNGTEDIWGINPDDNNGYPFLSWQEFTKQIPAIITEGVSHVEVTTAASSGVIVNIGEPEATEHGHVWSTSPMPTVADAKTELGPVVEGESFTSELTDLTPNTTHYVRAYVINEDYVAYGEEIEFKTDPQLLTINDFGVKEKVYNGDVVAQVNEIKFEGVLAAHADFSVGTVKAEFSHRRANEDNSVSLSGVQLIGNDAYKYIISLDNAPEVAARITPKALALPGLSVQARTYDGSKEVEVAGYGRLSGIVGDDDVTLVTDDVDVSFADSQAGVDKQVTVRGLVLTGQDADNYSISTATVRASIIPRELTVAADAQRKFSGDADPELSYQIVDGELVAGDELTGVLTREAGEDAGVYTIQLGTLANPNYHIDLIPAEFIIANSTFSISYSTSDIFVLGLENAIRLPELGQDDVIKVEVELVVNRLEVDHAPLFMATEALKDINIDVLEAFSIKLIKTVYYVDGSSADFGVPNEDIIGSFKVQMPLLEEFEAKNPGIVYIDADGNVTEFASSPVTVDGKTYLEFETTHLSVYAMVDDVEATGLTWLWILLGVLLVGGLILVGRKVIR
ncbi:MAG: hypothetical protein FH749_12300 [Firmicutes bacterium]|nr:hypothetical protein [Bacillota bacterium]